MTDPDRPGRTDAAVAWFEEFAACVRACDIDGGRRLFDPDCASFGARAEHLVGVDDLVARQWHPTWTSTQGFASVPGTMAVETAADGTVVVLTALWQSQGLVDDGSTFARRGRCTIILRADAAAPHGLRAVHSHFSLSPEADAPADP